MPSFRIGAIALAIILAAATTIGTSLPQPVPPSFDRALDCRNPRDAPLCREIQRNQAPGGGVPPSTYRAPTAQPVPPSPLQLAPQNPAPPSAARAVPQEAPITNCDTYAASDLDPQRLTMGVPFERLNSAVAIPECESAVRQFPKSTRLIFQLGRAYSKNNDFGSALVQYRNAADQGHVIAQYNLGVMYDRAQGVRNDDAQAVVWYRKAAEQGNASAQFNLANMYANGRGAPQNYAEAVRWHRQAAEQGNTGAQFNLGNMYADGRGVPQNYTEAAKWYRKAAEKGNAEAQANLADLYARLPNLRGISSSTSEAQAFTVVFDVPTFFDAPFVKGTTNLPDGTEFIVGLWPPAPACRPNCLGAQANSVVQNGRFIAGPFGIAPGVYRLEITTSIAKLQPPQVQAIIGQLGENLRGPYVKPIPVAGGGPTIEYISQIEIQRSAAAQTVSGQPNVRGDGETPAQAASPAELSSAALLAIVLLFVIAGIYLIPTIIAFSRHHRNSAAIFALNLLLGWTFLGWVAAFVWSLTTDTKSHNEAVTGY
jgi:hypothetical protein